MDGGSVTTRFFFFFECISECRVMPGERVIEGSCSSRYRVSACAVILDAAVPDKGIHT